MIGLQVKKGIVVNAAVFDKLPSGWVDMLPGVGIGWIDNGDGTFSPPAKEPMPEPTISEQIEALERTVTRRNLRGAALGDQFAIAEIQKVEDAIAALRT